MAYKKIFTLSFDDGLEQDKKIIRILKEYGIYGCTFHLNAGLLGKKQAMGRISEYGFLEKEDLRVLEKKHRFVHYVEDYRIPEDEVAQVYCDFEVASHAYRHENLVKLSENDLNLCIKKDKETLEKLIQKPVVGFSYPYGAVSDQAVEALRRNGIRYARTTAAGKNFAMSEDPYRLVPTRWIGQKDTMETVKRFIKEEPIEQDQLLYLWGHGYEFDYGTERNNWDQLKRLCDLISREDGILKLKGEEIFTN